MGADGAEDLFRSLRDDLHRIARRLMSGERAGHTLQTTALVNEAWIKLSADGPTPEGSDRAGYIRRAVEAMRQILIDHARGRNAEKRGGRLRRVSAPDDLIDPRATRNFDALVLAEALGKLAEVHPRPGQAMTLKLIEGFPTAEVAALLDVSLETIRTDLLFARAWLSRELGGDRRNGS